MRLNRVLLLAAGISCMIFAMVFTISCSGDKGARGPAGINGKDCSAVPMPNPAQGYVLSCGGEVVGNIYNGKNADGTLPGDSEPSCSLAPSATSGFAFSLNCGGTVVDIPAAGSGGGGGGGSGGGSCSATQANEYNPFWLVMNCGTTINVCLNGGAFDPETYVCTNGAKRTVDINRDYYNRGGYYTDINLATVLYSSSSAYISVNSDANTSFALNSSTSVSGGGKENLFPSITSGILLPKSAFICNETTGNVPYEAESQNRYYDPNKQFCYANNAPAYTNNSGALYKLKDLCGANDFLATKKFCFESKTGFKIVVSLCGGSETDGTGGSTFLYNQFCQPERYAISDGITASGSTSAITGLLPYNHNKSKVMPLCGNNDWTGKIVTGANDEIITYNAGKYYDSWLPSNTITGSVYDYGKYFEGYGFAEKKGAIVGGQQICDTDGIVKTKCGIPTAGSGSSATWVNNKILLF